MISLHGKAGLSPSDQRVMLSDVLKMSEAKALQVLDSIGHGAGVSASAAKAKLIDLGNSGLDTVGQAIKTSSKARAEAVSKVENKTLAKYAIGAFIAWRIIRSL